MRRTWTCLIIVLLALFFFTSNAAGVTVLVNVYEKEGNITPLSSASLYANGALVGKTNDQGSIEFSHPGTGNVGILVQKLGYSPWEGEIDANSTSLVVEMTRKKVPLMVQVYDADTMTPIPGAQVSLRDNAGENTTSTSNTGIASWNVTVESVYDVGVEVPNYHDFNSQVEVGLEQKTVQALLFRDDRFSVIIKDGGSGSLLPGATVLVDGVKKGVTDLKGIVILALPREKVYTIQTRMEGYEDYTQQQIVGKDQAFITVSLKKSPYSVFLSVYNEEKDPVEGASVFINGAKQGTTSKYGRLQLTNLTFGNYSLEIRDPGYVTLRQPLQVTVHGEDIPVELNYQHLNTSVKTFEGGSIPVSGVKISINGQDKGQTDGEGTLPVSVRLNMSYEFSAEKPGYNTAKVVKNVTSFNETAPLLILMERSIDWFLIGILCAVVVAAGLVGFILWKRGGSGRIHSGGGRL